MNIKTKYFGEIEVDETKRIQFSAGLPGFADESAFILLDLPGNRVFQLLQSLQTPSIAFVVTTPYPFYPNYAVELDDNMMENLNIHHEADVSLLAIVTLAEPFEKSTLNLKAPVIINVNQQCGKQYILNTEEYTSKEPINPLASESVKGEQPC